MNLSIKNGGRAWPASARALLLFALFHCIGSLPARAQAAPARSQAAQPPPAVSFRYIQAPRDSGAAARILAVHVEIAPGWHINSNAPLDEFLVPTALEAKAEGVEFGRPRFPKPERVHSEALGGDMLLFSGSFDIEVPARFAPAAKEGIGKREGRGEAPRTRVTLKYQACDHATCYPPKEVAIER